MRRTALTALALCGTLALAGCGGGAPTQVADAPPPADDQVAQPQETPTEDMGVPVGRAELADASGAPRGTVEFHETESGLRVVVEAAGLQPGFNGFHLHAVGACEPDSPDPEDASKTGDFLSSGGHLGEGAHPEHAGDLPSLLVMQDGTAVLDVRTDRLDADTLLDDDGTAVVVHGGPDNYANIPERYSATGADEQTTKAGDAGDRVACGVVEAP